MLIALTCENLFVFLAAMLCLSIQCTRVYDSGKEY
uniref:Uncharacterized protein n=1 Tax=Arundo donax TaxID=35708 RepID=A0A0A9ANV3_ARUDO